MFKTFGFSDFKTFGGGLLDFKDLTLPLCVSRGGLFSSLQEHYVDGMAFCSSRSVIAGKENSCTTQIGTSKAWGIATK